MSIFSGILIVLGLAAFEIISSVDNAIINAEVLSTMKAKYKKRFLFRGILFAVFVIRGLLPWLIIYFTAPQLGFVGSFTASFHSTVETQNIINQAAPGLMMGGGIFLFFLFLHRLFLDKKYITFDYERYLQNKEIGFLAISGIFLVGLIAYTTYTNHMIAIGAFVGSTAFFLTQKLKSNAEKKSLKMISKVSGISDISKIIYLEIIDATFSIDGVLGAFVFTLSVPLILIGNGLGAIIVRRITVSNIENIKKYKYLKNGAMYSIFFLGVMMMTKSFGMETPERLSPIVTFTVIGYFFRKSKRELKALKGIIE